MTVDEFVDQMDGCPEDLFVYAEVASEVEDEELRDSARALLQAACDFESILNNIGVSLG